MTILTKDAILAAADITTEDVLVPEWGGSVRVAVMSGRARDKFIALQGDGKAAYSEFQARVLVAAVVDEAGQPMFTEADVEALRDKSQPVLDRLVAVSMRLNGLGSQAVEEAKKNSDAAPSSDSGTASPSLLASQ
ncbi:hypothetical protein [Cupriavidus sp. YAF13]|uniref:hypothetical protein n=1 Tax=Cupriavidus sp. YAF13 TaxID=3233075 RepID=UPI003F9302F8